MSNFSPLISALGFAIIFALISFLGILLFRFKLFQNNLKYLISLAAGAMLADSFVHILPEAIESNGSFSFGLSLTFLVSILFSFLIESYFRWRECCALEKKTSSVNQIQVLGFMNLFGDAWCNFNDGITLVVAFLASPTTGLATGLAILLHEIPQEIADFGVLIHSGFSSQKAMLFNFIISLISILGVFFGYFVIANFPFLQSYFLTFGAGSITYLALSGLIPEVHKNHQKGFSWKSFLALIIGIILITLVKFIE